MEFNKYRKGSRLPYQLHLLRSATYFISSSPVKLTHPPLGVGYGTWVLEDGSYIRFAGIHDKRSGMMIKRSTLWLQEYLDNLRKETNDQKLWMQN